MSKRLIAVLAIVGVVAAGITGGVAVAQTSDGGEAAPVQGFVGRVANILGLEPEQVQDAFLQARREMQNESLKMRLDRMVERGLLTQEQAAEQYNWFQSRPENLAPGIWGGGKTRQGFGPERIGKPRGQWHGPAGPGARWRRTESGQFPWGGPRHKEARPNGADPGAPAPETIEPAS